MTFRPWPKPLGCVLDSLITSRFTGIPPPLITPAQTSRSWVLPSGKHGEKPHSLAGSVPVVINEAPRLMFPLTQNSTWPCVTVRSQSGPRHVTTATGRALATARGPIYDDPDINNTALRKLTSFTTVYWDYYWFEKYQSRDTYFPALLNYWR